MMQMPDPDPLYTSCMNLNSAICFKKSKGSICCLTPKLDKKNISVSFEQYVSKCSQLASKGDIPSAKICFAQPILLAQ